jgi:hypothetical protein
MDLYKFSRRRYDLASLGKLLEESRTAAKLGDLLSARWALRRARQIVRAGKKRGQKIEYDLKKLAQTEEFVLSRERWATR